MSRAEPSVGYCLSSTSPPDFSAAPVRARDRDRSLRPARPGRLAATVLVVGLVLLGAAAAEAQTERILVSNTAVGNDDTANTSGNDHAQLFHTGGHTGGYTLTKVRVNSEDDEGDDFDVEVCEEDGSADEFPSTTASDCTALTAPSDFTAGLVLFTHAGLALSANTNYVVVIKQRGTGSVRLKSTTNTGEDTSLGLSGWSIKDKFYWKSGSTWMIKSGSNETLRIVVSGYEGVPVVVTDATLSALSVSGATLSPAFDAGTTSYHAVVANAVSQVTITETTSESTATVEYLDGSDATRTDADTMTAGLQVNLSVGSTIVKVKVTAPDTTTTQTYTVNVFRVAVPVACSAASMTNRIWTGNLTVGTGTNEVGFSAFGGSLDNTNFSYKGTSYTIEFVTIPFGIALQIGLSAALGASTNDLVLHVGTEQYAFADATFAPIETGYGWFSNFPSWADGDAVCLALTVDGPDVSSVALTSDPGTPGTDNTYAVSNRVKATVTFDAAVDITGTPQLELDFAGTPKPANCTAATNTTTMACSYTVVENDSAPNGIAIAANKLTLNGGTITATGSTTITADLDHVAVAIDANHKVDGIFPTLVTTGSEAPRTSTDGTQVILTFSEDVVSPDRGVMTIRAGGNVVSTSAASANGPRVDLTLTTALTSSTVVVTVALSLDAVLDTASNGNLAVAATAVINAITDDPVVSSVALTSTPGSDNTYGIGDAVEATVTFSAAVDITGTPQLELDFAGTAKAATCTAATNTTTMACSYTVVENDSAPNGIAIAANKLTLNGGTITATGSTTITADLDHVAVMIDAGHKVDGIRPTLVTTGSEAPTTSTDGTKIILFFNEFIGTVDRTKITVKSGTTTQATPLGSVLSGPRLEIALATALTSADTAVTVELGADAVTDGASNGNLAVPATAVTNAITTAATEREALEALYNATGGATWTNNTNWLSAEALSEWHGVSTDATGRVTDLYLTQNGLSGEIPAELGDLTTLQNLYLWQNNLSGEIPAELGGLTNLQILFLEDNNLSGAIPVELGDLASLQNLYLRNNNLSGSIPAELGDLTNLRTLDLQNNNLSGAIPAELGDLTNLQNLFLRNNNLSGAIPAELGNLTSLLNLFLRNNNLSGEIPAELGRLTSLLILDLLNNNLSGEIPAELGDLTSLQNLYLAQNGLSGSIPEELGDLTSLLYLYLWGTELSGAIPAELGRLTSLLILDLARNNLSGEIPAELGDLTNLEFLDLSLNELSGEIPAELGDLTSLQRLYLYNNQLTGSIPEELGDLTSLLYLYLGGNELTGPIPAALGGLTSLQRLYLQENELTGPIPAELGDLTNLKVLGLWSNQLTGMIPAAVGVAADRGALEGFYNATDGPNWTVGTNWLTTEEPLSAWHGVTTDSNGRVTRVVLSNNELTGTISVAVEQLENLEQLILSVNDELTGTIPVGLMNLSGLVTLNVSGTNVCTPTDAAFQGWLATITFQGGTVCEPPDAPENLTTMAGNARVTLAWTKGDDGGSTITKHQIQQKEGSAEYGAWMDISDSAAGQKNQASHTVTGLTNGTNYAFRVRAVNDEGESDASVEATATPAVPPLTVSVTITAAEIVVDEGRNAEFTLLRSGSAVEALEVKLSVSESGDMLRSPVPKRVTFPASAARVTLTVRTVNDGGDERDSVVTVTVGPGTGYEPVSANASASMTVRDNDRTPPRPPGSGGGGGGTPRTSVPGAVRNLTAAGGNGEAVLSWDAPSSDGGAEITDYQYRINGRNPWIAIGSTDTTHTVTGLVNGTVYVFEVRAVNRIGRGRASNRAEATPEAPEVFTQDFAHFANGTGITSEMVLVNVAPHPIRPAIYFYDRGGDLIDPESVVDVTGDLEVTEDGSLSVLTEMEPLEALTISTHGQGELVSGSVKVLSDGPIGGGVRYGLPEIGVAGVGASPPVRDVLFPARRQEGGMRTATALHNLGAEAMGVRCRLMSGGVSLEEAEIPLEANGQASWFIEEAFPTTDTSDFLGSVRCTVLGSRRFTAIAVEVDAAQRIFNTLSVVPLDRTGGGNKQTTLDFAHFANGTWITDLVFVNLSTEASRPAPSPFHTDILPSRPAIYFYDTEGNPIAPASVVDITGDLEITEDGALTVRTEMEPLGVLTISTHGRGQLVSGSVRVVSDGPIGGMLRFEHPDFGVAGVGASPPLSDALFPVRRQEGGITTGVALHNLESSPGLLRCDLMREGVLLDAASIPLEANGQTSWLIDQAFPAADTSDFAGSVRCDAVGEGLFSAVALEMDPGNRIFATLPVVPVPEMPDQE